MSDVKQDILDELIVLQEDECVYTADVVRKINKHLEGMVVVPEKATDEMVEIGDIIGEVAGADRAWKAMLESFKEQS